MTVMPVPDYEAVMLPLLRAVADGAEHHVRDVRERIAGEFKLAPADRAEMLPSGKQSVFDNRVGWAKTYMDKAGLVESVRRGVYRITKAGKAVLAEKPAQIDKEYLKRFAPFQKFLALQHMDEEDETTTTSEGAFSTATPDDQLATAYRKIRQKLESEVLDAVLKASPQFFEKLVVELLVAMGYGGSFADASRALGKSGDGGIDGIINEDRLGFDAIYVQAKRWTDNTVGRPTVQSFAGSLLAKKGRKGVFITTSTFSRDAHEYVKEIEANAKIVLIDGLALAAHMVDFGVGVSTESTFEVKRLDSDYFSEE
jgi:restriction system protein